MLRTLSCYGDDQPLSEGLPARPLVEALRTYRKRILLAPDQPVETPHHLLQSTENTMSTNGQRPRDIHFPQTEIEIVEAMHAPKHGRLIRPTEVRVNGIPVLVEKDSLNFDFGTNGAVVRVTMTILPEQVTFRRAEPYEAPDKSGKTVAQKIVDEYEKSQAEKRGDVEH